MKPSFQRDNNGKWTLVRYPQLRSTNPVRKDKIPNEVSDALEKVYKDLVHWIDFFEKDNGEDSVKN